MDGFILNTDPVWFDFVIEHNITSPIFWFKRDSNPSSKGLVVGNRVFLRITGTKPPVIRAIGTIISLQALTVQDAVDKFGYRMGYPSIKQMISASELWTSSVDLTRTSSIFCLELDDLRLTRDIRVDMDLGGIGIVFDHQHIVTGKRLDAEQTGALLQIAELLRADTPRTVPLKRVSEPTQDYSTLEEASVDESARFLESHLQWFIFNNLAALGISGLQLYSEESQAESHGKYRTAEVGEIDLLLKTVNGDLIVVELKKSATDKTIGQICRYMGWVRHRLASQGQQVRGIIVVQDHDDRLSYAASVVPDLTIKRIKITFTIANETMELPE